MSDLALGRPYTALDRLHVPWRRSLVAAMNAHFRARETLRPEGDRVLVDPWAVHLAEEHAMTMLLRALEWVVPAVRRTAAAQATAHCVRHASIDVLVAEALAEGFGQVVVVGAGYDMRATRLLPLPPSSGGGSGRGVRWFEVDQPALAERKERLLAGRDVTPVVRVGLDVGRDALAPALMHAGWSAAEPTCFVIEGLLHYLERDRVRALLSEAATGGRRRVIASYIEPAMSNRVTSTFREVVRVLGEIPRTFFTREEIVGIFAEAGLGEVRTWDHLAQVRSFAPAGVGRPAGLTQEVVAAG